MILTGPRREQRLYEEAIKDLEKVAVQLDEARRFAWKMIDSVESSLMLLDDTAPLQPIFERMQANAAKGHWSSEWMTYIQNEQLTNRHHLMKQGRKWHALAIEMNDAARQMNKMAKEVFQLLIHLTDNADKVKSYQQLSTANRELVKDILNNTMALSKLLAKQWQEQVAV